MRDLIYIVGLFVAICVLAVDFPSSVVDMRREEPKHVPFASYVQLSPSVHAAYLESARTSWQVRSGSRNRPVIGSLDSGVPLLVEPFPVCENVEFRRFKRSDSPVGPSDIESYLLLPGSEGADSPKFSAKPQTSIPEECGKRNAFSKDEMLSVDQFRKLKEIMQ